MCENIVNIFHNYNPTDNELQNYCYNYLKNIKIILIKYFIFTTFYGFVLTFLVIEFEIF